MDNNLVIADKRHMEEMLADYAFGRLSEAERTIFERSLPNFPDIEREAEEVRKVFDRVRRTDFEDYYDRHTRNLSVNVLRRFENRGNIRQTLTRLIPALGVTACLIMFSIWQKPIATDATGETRTASSHIAAGADNYTVETSVDDEIAEVVCDFAPDDEMSASVEAKDDAEILTAISAPLNESFLEEQMAAHLSDSDLSNLLESNDDGFSL
ncbi:hypothetical protein MASR2M18_20010 [Ignavibacteria bacterium]|nr:hypothetical protein [Bacteroidota bacterium]MCZ2132855.1 hypothetical protein [Bacteroidota bacterium]